MILQKLRLKHFGPFEDVSFDLASYPGKPLVLFTGNNGAGKTTLLQALRLVLHGRRSFAAGISDLEYNDLISSKFKDANFEESCTVGLDFRYTEDLDDHEVSLVRGWTSKSGKIREELSVAVDGADIRGGIADEFLLQIIPPELLTFFFFDAERIAELTDWDSNDDLELFSSVDQLLGLSIADQLQRDLKRIAGVPGSTKDAPLAAMREQLGVAEERSAVLSRELKVHKTESKQSRRRYENARVRVLAVGAIFAEERRQLEGTLTQLIGTRDSVKEQLRREAGGYLPLLMAPRSLQRLAAELELSEALESANALSQVLKEKQSLLARNLRGFLTAKVSDQVCEVVRSSLLPRPVALDHAPPDLSLREIHFMKDVFVSELPRLRSEISGLLTTLGEVDGKIDEIEGRLRTAPPNDPKAEEVLSELERAQREVIAAETAERSLEEQLSAVNKEIENLHETLRKNRNQKFRSQKQRQRGEIIERLLVALPAYASAKRTLHQEDFARLLQESLSILWHKKNRVLSVEVNFLSRSIVLLGEKGPISKRDLSAGEKQLFAIAFIVSLAKLSGKTYPFVIDTPLARLDHSHRDRLLVRFLPFASPQVVLFSTDTEIIGGLYTQSECFIASQFELSEYNGGVTDAVDLGFAV